MQTEPRSSLATQKFLSQTPSILYTAVVKGKVALPCDITPPTLDDQVVLILWYKDEQLAPIYTLDARRGNLEQARTLTNNILDGRAYFNLHNRPAFLQIDPIRVTDAGDYRCRVDFRKARTVNTVISLKVIVPPEEPIIVDMDNNELSGLIGPYNEGDELRLICSTSGGKPRPSLSWWRDYSIIDDTFEYNEKDVTTNQLTITSLARHHLLSIFTCQAINNNITVPSSTSITLDLNLKPTDVRISQLTPILVSDREATFECNTYGSRPKATLYWIFDGSRHNTPLNGEHQTSTTLTITLKHAHNDAILTCVAENSKIQSSIISDELKLDVHYIPQLSLQLGTPTISLQSLQEGNDIYFDCHIDANPRPNAPILWRFNGNILHPQQGIIQSNVSLVLQRVTRSQSGTYQCEASNQQGIALSNAIHLKIKYAPVCITHFILAYGVSLMESVDLICGVEANPSQVSFQWTFDGNIELTSFKQFNETSSILSYSPTSLQDYGTVECTAKNSIGLQQRGCKYHIIDAGPPKFPFMCQVVNQSDNALVILCTGNEQSSSQLANNLTSNEVDVAGDPNFNQIMINNNNNNHNKQYANSQNSLSPTVLVYPTTYYMCEVYTPGNQHLVANVSLPASLTTNSILSDSGNTDSTIWSTGSTVGTGGTPPTTTTTTTTFQLFVPNLTPATSFQLKLFAINSKGKSDQIWLRAQTLRPAERLVDADSNTNNNNNELLNTGQTFKTKPMLMALLIGAAVVTVIVISLGIIAVVRVRRSSSANVITNESTQPNSRLQDRTTVNTIFEEDDDCQPCYGDDCCDQMLLTSTTTSNQQHLQQSEPQMFSNCNTTKGPPDIIPSFGYITTGYQNEDSIQYVPTSDGVIHYAELAFCGQPMIQQSGQQTPITGGMTLSKSGSQQLQQQCVEYAKLEFNKTQTPVQRVNIIGGSPKFESTV
ncbi:hemicentin-1-like [Oppia nitens]|uniref:hemicentin-1-like n=1 Tax=Oppia nitens TaxID=1686743 RepID=UPI0023DA5EBD|nr:hemicentin-1-like [Oppia nitens]